MAPAGGEASSPLLTPSPVALGTTMNERCLDTDHLRGLKRISPCCQEPVHHPYSFDDKSYKRVVAMICSKCAKRVSEHWLVNQYGEVVWPPPKALVDAQPTNIKRKRCRRKVLLEQDPEPFRVLY
jgi:hypothetical protein